MKILLVSSVFPPLAGGPSAQTYHLARLLKAAGHEAVVITFHEAEPSSILPNVEVHSLEFAIKVPVLSHLAIYSKLAGQLWSVFRRHHFDIVHIQTGASFIALVTLFVAKLFNVPVVAKVPGDMVFERLNPGVEQHEDHADATRRGLKATVLTQIQRFMFHRYRLIWAANDFIDAALQNTYHYPKERIVRIPNYRSLGTFENVDRSKRTSAPIQILAALRFAPMYRVPDLVEIFNRIRDESTSMTIIGTGFPEVEKQVQERITALALQDRVKLLGNVDPATMPSHMAQADIFMHMAYHPWPGIVVIEAMASGLPVVVHHDPPQDQPYPSLSYDCVRTLDEAADYLRKLIRNPDLRTDEGEHNVHVARDFNLDDNLDKFLTWYRQALGITT